MRRNVSISQKKEYYQILQKLHEKNAIRSYKNDGDLFVANYTKPWEWKFHGPVARRISKSSLRGGHHSGLRYGFASTLALVMPTTLGGFSDPTGLRPVELPQCF